MIIRDRTIAPLPGTITIEKADQCYRSKGGRLARHLPQIDTSGRRLAGRGSQIDRTGRKSTGTSSTCLGSTDIHIADTRSAGTGSTAVGGRKWRRAGLMSTVAREEGRRNSAGKAAAGSCRQLSDLTARHVGLTDSGGRRTLSVDRRQTEENKLWSRDGVIHFCCSGF